MYMNNVIETTFYSSLQWSPELLTTVCTKKYRYKKDSSIKKIVVEKKLLVVTNHAEHENIFIGHT